MANTLSAFFENLVAATDGFNTAVVGQTALIDGVYRALEPEVKNRSSKTITIPFPDFAAFTDIGAGSLSDQNMSPTSVVLDFANHAAGSYRVADLEEWQNASDLREKFLEPMYMRAAEYLNGQIAALITAANFNVNPVIAGATPALIDVIDATNAWDLLADQKVPLGNSDDLSVFVHNNTYRRMLSNAAWVQESMVGRGIAEPVRKTGEIPNAFNLRPRYDQQAPKVSAALGAGTVAVTNGSATVTGTSTTFTTAGPAGVSLLGYNLSFAGDTTRAQYRVIAVASNTSLTLERVYAGPTASGIVATYIQYTVLAMHRYAIALGLRPFPSPDTNMVNYRPLMYRGIPLRVMMSYQHPTLSWLMSVDFGFGLKVIRPAFGVLITC